MQSFHRKKAMYSFAPGYHRECDKNLPLIGVRDFSTAYRHTEQSSSLNRRGRSRDARTTYRADTCVTALPTVPKASRRTSSGTIVDVGYAPRKLRCRSGSAVAGLNEGSRGAIPRAGVVPGFALTPWKETSMHACKSHDSVSTLPALRASRQ